MNHHNSFYLIFGLTADPPHKGHEQVIINSHEFMHKAGFEVSQFDLVPTFEPNLIAGKRQPVADFEQRMAMCQIIADDLNQNKKYNVRVNEIERFLAFATHQKSYSYQTLKAIDHPNKLFVLSADHFAGRWPKFRKWHKWQALIKENGLLIHQRPGHRINNSFIQQLQSTNTHVYIVKDFPEVAVSSTFIRKNFSQSMRGNQQILSQNVIDFIAQHEIY